MYQMSTYMEVFDDGEPECCGFCSVVVSGSLVLRGVGGERSGLWKECVWRKVDSVGVDVY
jgi:hypothetical protein